MEFKTTYVLKFPCELTWNTMQERLAEVAALNEEIDYMLIKEKHTTVEEIHITSEWKASPALPGFVMDYIKPEYLVWTDSAIWNNKTKICHWKITPHAFPDSMQCSGRTHFESAMGGSGTKITFQGSLHASAGNSSAPLNGIVMKALEVIVSKIIPNNFTKTAKLIGEFLEKQ